MDIPEGYVLIPIEPTKEMLRIIAYREWPKDWEVGKDAQFNKVGLDVIPPVCEFEIAYGQYRRLIDAGRKELPWTTQKSFQQHSR
jgi:hypothetical protein